MASCLQVTWAFDELSRMPRALDIIRRELDDLFGPETSPAGRTGPAALSRYLRLYPPSGMARYQPPGTEFCVQMGEGETVCIDGMVVYNCLASIQRDEAVYGSTKDDFVPERWLEPMSLLECRQVPGGRLSAVCAVVPDRSWLMGRCVSFWLVLYGDMTLLK
ncbi:hypothetical protein BDV23DRAFT_182110 [Aspergillus alliaceus]|uniref:Cytochrome P450 n=1 Tax=Petromyces alliaceus TaxID=209559 RepID=A0A5N7CCV2_PETAA|nr:hypothetical protein BDV23DRAFT_182110 [Aspergillus alliaceus]